MLALLLLLAGRDVSAPRPPALTTVCRRTGTRECWAEPGDGTCARGEPFRRVSALPHGPEVKRALADCALPSRSR